MKKLILQWLFGTTHIDSYMELLRENRKHLTNALEHTNECLELIREHRETIDRAEWFIEIANDLIKVCEKHGIDIDEEVRLIRLEEVNVNETLD